MTTAEARSLLAKFGLGPDQVARATRPLSPGERTRAELALFQGIGVDFLVLDEPTNHLDLPAIEQLESALDRFDGTPCSCPTTASSSMRSSSPDIISASPDDGQPWTAWPPTERRMAAWRALGVSTPR